MIDRDDLAEAMASAANACRDAGGSAPARQVAQFRTRLGRFLDDLPGEVSVAELRELLDEEETDDEEE